jgi:hypothetical protein
MVLTRGRTSSVKKEDNEDTESVHTAPASYVPEIDVALSSLSSKGMTYPKDTKVSYRSYSYGDLLYYNDSQLSELSRMRFVVSGISVSPINVNDMTYWDVMFIGLLRNLSRGNMIEASLTFSCPECKFTCMDYARRFKSRIYAPDLWGLHGVTIQRYA